VGFLFSFVQDTETEFHDPEAARAGPFDDDPVVTCHTSIFLAAIGDHRSMRSGEW
jgi:hypothetical protein